MLYYMRKLMTHHNLGDNIQHFLVASAATGGAVGYLLYVFESSEDTIEGFMGIQSVGKVGVGYLFTVANHIVFLHDNSSQT